MNRDIMCNDLFEMIKLSLWGNGNPTITVSLFNEMKLHAISALPGSVLSSLDVPPELEKPWKENILHQIAFNAYYLFTQTHLPVRVPYVILKGTAAAQYYPYPEYRIQGDIDIMTKREDFEHACLELKENGWEETTNGQDFERGRHRTFQKGNVIVENHAFFASMNDPIKAKIFDDLIIDNITEKHVLPDIINGLVLIDHINQHLEEGLGLRQIIDWMMFADKCLKDDLEWYQFKEIAEKTGLMTLAITVTRMCEIYLGLPVHKWCACANEKLCHMLMNYILNCGNFGNKRDETEKLAIGRMNRLRHPVKTIKELQRLGKENWTAGGKPFLCCFAWVWQGFYFLKNTPQYKEGYKQARHLSVMFDALGVKRIDNGLAYYINGEYVKK